MKRFLPLLIALCFSFVASLAQEMHIEEFAKLKKGPLNMNHVVTNKQQAIIDVRRGARSWLMVKWKFRLRKVMVY